MIKAKLQYQPVAARAALLFFVVQDLSKLQHVYQFSLKWFMDIFEGQLRSEDENVLSNDPVIDLNMRLT